jgi:hypothetical protein
MTTVSTRSTPLIPHPRLWLLAVLVGACAFRLGFGLCAPLFTEDETQIYLLGLRFHTTHAWPFFGPDVVWTESQIPGALQALLVGLPFEALPIPEAPYVLLTLLSTGALAAFAWYLCARLPGLPRWLVWGWLMTLPWTLELSTHIINPSYVLPASLVFFIAWLEAWPRLSTRRLPPAVCHALMGAAVAWTAQVHMSWPLLVPFVGLALLARLGEGRRAVAMAAAAFVAGLLTIGIFVLPTWITFGLQAGSGGTGANLDPHWRNPVTTVLTTLARLLAFSSYEVNRFLATGSARQLVFLQQHWWIAPAAAVLWLTGLLHPLWMGLTAFRRRSAAPDWPAVRWLLLGTATLVSVSFFFSAAPAQARSFYVVAPVGFLYAAYAWTFIDSRRTRLVAAAVLGINLFFQTSLAITRLSGPSLYMNRARVVEALERGRPDLFAHRRPFGRDLTPTMLATAVEGADAPAHLVVTEADVSRGIRDLVVWSVVIHNRSERVAYRDLWAETTYFDRDGHVLETRLEPVWVVIEPGERRRAQVVDGARWPPDTARSDLRIVDGAPLPTAGGSSRAPKDGVAGFSRP